VCAEKEGKEKMIQLPYPKKTSIVTNLGKSFGEVPFIVGITCVNGRSLGRGPHKVCADKEEGEGGECLRG